MATVEALGAAAATGGEEGYRGGGDRTAAEVNCVFKSELDGGGREGERKTTTIGSAYNGMGEAMKNTSSCFNSDASIAACPCV